MSIAQNEECCYLIGGFGPVEDVEEDEEDSNEEIKEKADQQVSSLSKMYQRRDPNRIL